MSATKLWNCKNLFAATRWPVMWYTFSRAEINILRVCVCETTVFSFKTRLFANARSGSRRENSSRTETLLYDERISISFPPLPSSIPWFIENISFLFSIPVSFVFSAYISFFLLLSFFEKRGRGERLASVNPGIFLDKIYGNSIDTRGLFVLQAFDIYIERERE